MASSGSRGFREKKKTLTSPYLYFIISSQKFEGSHTWSYLETALL
jgi:hypothetical protein